MTAHGERTEPRDLESYSEAELLAELRRRSEARGTGTGEVLSHVREEKQAARQTRRKGTG